MTTYVVLRSDEGANLFSPLGEADAGNWEAAVSAFLEKEVGGQLNGEKYGEGEYAAVPKRSWPDKPKPIRKKISFG